MTKQEAFNNMIAILNGKGPSHDDGECVYFPDDGHPGCGIGCQPGFREKFGPGSEFEIPEGRSIRALMESKVPSVVNPEIELELRKFFGEDITPYFAGALQGLHDANLSSWHGDKWIVKSLATFAERHDLSLDIFEGNE